MKILILITILISLFSCNSSPEREVLEKFNDYKTVKTDNPKDISKQNKEGYWLKWKLAEGNIIGYQTILKVLEAREIDFGGLGDSSGFDNDFFKEELDELRKEMEETTYISTISYNARGKMEVKMFSEGFEQKGKEEIDPKDFNMSQMMKGVMLRGEIDKYGNIESFYVKERQRNLLAMYFQLPDFPVEIGDTWSLDVHYLQMDQNFICDTAQNKNVVQFVELQKDGQDTIAIIKYDIFQYVKGTMGTYAMMGNNNGEVSIAMKFNGVAEFSITQGKWISFDGILETVQDGVMKQSSKQHLGLRLLDDITEEMKNVK